jgi:DNA-directed RNA polymerase specialized sigma24 family protein
MVVDDSAHSVSKWIIGARLGEDQAIQRLWECYFERLVVFARHRLAGMPRRVADEEDVALSAFASFCHVAREGRFPKLADRDGLWRLLLTFTAAKATDLRRKGLCKKRGAGEIRGDSGLIDNHDSNANGGLDQVIGDVPTPDFAAMAAEEYRILINLLDDEIRPVALAKMEGFTNSEVASRFRIPVSRVERTLRLIRQVWREAKREYAYDD